MRENIRKCSDIEIGEEEDNEREKDRGSEGENLI